MPVCCICLVQYDLLVVLYPLLEQGLIIWPLSSHIARAAASSGALCVVIILFLDPGNARYVNASSLFGLAFLPYKAKSPACDSLYTWFGGYIAISLDLLEVYVLGCVVPVSADDLQSSR